ncbi:gliding motility protein RemB [Desertivirga arenae]|uniref:gliding motility protein RemB n=1 Tax=Desertivirga arenae TaxID=2810309 RepID=UPI001A959ADE|nr:gliding motility protein RemB [Pedobacter sp. SYSU D00823]
MRRLFFVAFFLILYTASFAQSQTFQYDYNFYQRINSVIYSIDSNIHTALKPINFGHKAYKALDSVYNLNTDSTHRSLVHRKLFSEHLIQIEREDFNVYIDFLPDFQVGKDFTNKSNTWLNTRGFQVQGNIGKKFSFYTSAFENQSRFPAYLRSFIDSTNVIPGQVNDKFGRSRVVKDWAYASAVLNYTPNKYFSFSLGQDKNFIGDGYRSMLLSDVATNYPFFKIVTTLGNVQYTNIWAQLEDLTAAPFSYDNGFRKKWGAFHYLDWNVTKRFSLGFFEAIIWQDADEAGKRGFDVSYLTPLIFLRTVEGYNGSPDNALIGFNTKYKVARNLTAYGQVLLDEFTAKEVFAGNGYWANKFAGQLGVKGFDAFKVKDLNFLAEFNLARPFTYSQRSSLLNYGHYNQPLAHPFGANFKEFVSIWNYNLKRWQLRAQGNFAVYGLDQNGSNYGKNIFKSYNTRIANYDNSIAQGLKTNFTYLDGRVSFLMNPKINLRLEAGAVIRKESNSLGDDKTTWFTLGLRSSFRDIYQDF